MHSLLLLLLDLRIHFKRKRAGEAEKAEEAEKQNLKY